MLVREIKIVAIKGRDLTFLFFGIRTVEDLFS